MSAAGAIAGGLVSGGLGLIGQSQTNKTNRSIANEQMAFEAAQSDTVYQRGVKDLQAAGLNPMLAVAHPDPVAQYTPASYKSPISSAMEAGITNFSALQTARQNEAAISNTKAQENLNNALAVKAAADTTSALSSAENTAANTAKTKAGSFMSNVVGSDLAAKTSQWLNRAVDNSTSQLDSIITGVRANSAKALSYLASPWDALGNYAKSKWGKPAPAGNPDLPPPPPPLSYWKGRH